MQKLVLIISLVMQPLALESEKQHRKQGVLWTWEEMMNRLSI